MIGFILSAVVLVNQNFTIIMTLSAVLSSVITGLTMPFYGAVLGLLYIDTRIRREGLAVRLLQATQRG